MQDARKMQAIKMVKSYSNNITIDAAVCCPKTSAMDLWDRTSWTSGCTASLRSGVPPMGKGMPMRRV